MHGVRAELLDRQIAALGVPAIKVPIPSPCPNEIYEARMEAACAQIKSRGIHHIVFGDLFLEDIRAYRVEKLKPARHRTHLPALWRRPTAQLARARDCQRPRRPRHLPRPAQAPAQLRRPHLRQILSARSSRRRRPLRGKRRIPYGCNRRPDVLRAHPRHHRRNGGTRRLCLYGRCASLIGALSFTSAIASSPTTSAAVQ